MTVLLVDGAMILTPTGLIERGHVLVDGNLIAEVGGGAYAGPKQPDRTIDGRRRLVAPGLVNAHTHSQSCTMSGFADRLSHPAFMWLTQAHTSQRSADEIRLAVLLTAYGMLTSGTTAAIDHFPGQRFTAADMEAVLGAWRETGMRIGLAMRFFDAAFADIFPDVPLPDDIKSEMAAAEVLKPHALEDLGPLMEDTIRRWHGREGRLSVLPAPSNPERCSDKALEFSALLAARYDTGIHTHLLETEKQARIAQSLYGTTAVGHLDELGILSDRWSCAHCIWLTDADMDRMAARGAIAVLNPESNARIGTGRARVPEMRRRGMRPALGTDGSGANDNQVMHEAMRIVATEHRAGDGVRADWISAADALQMATTGGAGALRTPNLGAIAPGQLADFVLYRLDAPWWLPVNDAVNQLVFAETGAAADTVVIDGRVVMEDRRITTFDAGALFDEINAMVRSLRVRNDKLFRVAQAIADFVP